MRRNGTVSTYPGPIAADRPTTPRARAAPAGAALPSAQVTEAIHRAVLQGLEDPGYARLSVEAVARAAGVGKAAVYRRWPSKEAMVVGVVSAVGVPLAEVADHGSLAADVAAVLAASRRLLDGPARLVVADLVAEAGRSPELARLLDEVLNAPRRAAAGRVLERAVARGELGADIDLELALDVLPSAVYWRQAVRRRPLTDADLARLTAASVAALRALG